MKKHYKTSGWYKTYDNKVVELKQCEIIDLWSWHRTKIPKIKEIAIPYCGIVFAEMKHVIEINKVEHLTLYV